MPGKLEKAFDFEDSEILLNQNGQISQRQTELIEQYRRIRKFGGRISFVVMFLSLGGLMLGGFYGVGFDLEKNLAPILAFAAVFAIGAFLYLFSMWLGKRSSDLKSGKISVVEGFAECKTKMHRNWKAYYVTIGKVKFQMDTAAKYNTFKPDVCYRVFYVKHPPTHVVLSIAENTQSDHFRRSLPTQSIQ